MFPTLVFLVFLIRLVILIPHFEVEKSLNFFTGGNTIDIYKGVIVNRISFSLPLPQYQENDLSTLNETIAKFDRLNFNKTGKQGILLSTYLTDSKELAIRLKENFLEIIKYGFDTDGTVFKKQTCHDDILLGLSEKSIPLLTYNIKMIFKNLGDKTTSEQIEQKGGKAFKEFSNAFNEVNVLTYRLKELTEHYLNILEELSKKQVSKYLFNYLKNGKCIDPNPSLDEFLVEDCHFMKTSVNCNLQIRHPFDIDHYKIMMPIPYYGYAIQDKDMYIDPKSSKVIKIECRDYDPVRQNCEKNSDNNECIIALNRDDFDDIVKECTFEKSLINSPVLTENGILISDSNNLTIKLASSENDLIHENATIFDYTEYATCPFIIKTTEFLLLTDPFFTMLFPKSGNNNVIYTTKYLDSEVKSLIDDLESPINLDEDDVELLINVSLITIILVLVGIGITIAFRFRQIRKTLFDFQIRYPEPHLPKELKRFLDGKPEKIKKRSKSKSKRQSNN